MGANAGREIAIIGGGIGGLTAALAFAQYGAHVRVFEQAAAISEVGAGLQITPNGARVLHALGLGDALAKTGIHAKAVVPTDALNGRNIARFDLTGQHPAYSFLHRAALVDLLAKACADRGVQLELGARVTEFDADGAFDTGAGLISPCLTIGADGLHSVVRRKINADAAPFFTGQVAWRATVPCTDAAPVARIWMAPGRHVVTYPLQGGRLNIVAVQERGAWAAEGWHHADDPANLRAAFADCAPTLQDILRKVEATNLWGLFRHPVADHWSKGSLVILGDAAHPTLPFLAQGANLAIEDAYTLARACDTHDDVPTALHAYQKSRRPRVERAIKAANANAGNYHLSGLNRIGAHAALYLLGRVAPGAFLRRLGWLYDHDVTR